MSWFSKKREDDAPCHRRGPNHACLVIDVSGSMSSRDLSPDRLSAAKTASCGYVTDLKDACPSARVSVISYSDYATTHCRALIVSEKAGKICSAIKNLDIRGSTDIGRALSEVERILAAADCGGNVQVVLLSDGHHNGTISPCPVAKRLKEKWSARIDCVGVGSQPSAVDEPLMKDIASKDENGHPRYHFIRETYELLEHFKQLAGYLSSE